MNAFRTTMRGVPMLSPSAMNRPASRCIPITLRYWGVTPFSSGENPPGFGRESRPGISSDTPCDASKGWTDAGATARTPGMRPIIANHASGVGALCAASLTGSAGRATSGTDTVTRSSGIMPTSAAAMFCSERTKIPVPARRQNESAT